jgi:glucose-6-phosphate isomerase, archaeal
MISTSIAFDLATGLSYNSPKKPLTRKASDLVGVFSDTEALSCVISQNDPLVYEFYDLGIQEKSSDIAYGTSIVYPGKIGREFYMTKGHFHTILDTAEVYLCLSGHGLMLMENPEGEVEYQELHAGETVYVPGRYAHRSVNLSPTEPLVTFFAFRADAGHDYGSIVAKGFRKLVVAEGGEGFALEDNPAWLKE